MMRGLHDWPYIAAAAAVGVLANSISLNQEWRTVSPIQYLGMVLALAGIFLMLFFPKHIKP